jgi:hypothetical protein
MARDYPPMSVNTCLQAALNDANVHWGGGGGVHNCGNQGTEYTTAGRMDTVKTRWRNAPNVNIGGTAYARRASDSMSAVGMEIDLKLVPTANPDGPAAFNYHIAIDVEAFEKAPPPNLDKQKDSWRIINNLRRQEWKDNHGGSTSGYFDMPFKPW